MKLHRDPILDQGWGGLELAVDDTHRWLALPQLFNVRFVSVPLDDQFLYDHGWCYHSMVDVVMAAGLFDPRTQNEPLGWHKRPTTPARVAPAPDECVWVDYNGPRCVHGSWLKSGACGKVDVCPDFLDMQEGRTVTGR